MLTVTWFLGGGLGLLIRQVEHNKPHIVSQGTSENHQHQQQQQQQQNHQTAEDLDAKPVHGVVAPVVQTASAAVTRSPKTVHTPPVQQKSIPATPSIAGE